MTDTEELLKTQEELKKRIKELEEALKEKKQLTGYDRERELEDMVKVALRENKKVIDKVNYLMDMLIQASESESDEAVEKTLASLSKSQLKLLEQISVLRDKVEKAQSSAEIMKTQQEMIKNINKRLASLEDIIRKLPHSQQIESIQKEVSEIEKDVEALEEKITTSPNAVMQGIEMLKKQVGDLKNRIDLISSEVSKSKNNNVAALLDVLKTKIDAVESKVNNISEVVTSGRPLKEAEVKKKVAEVKEDLRLIEELKKRVDETLKISKEEHEKLIELLKQMRDLEEKINSITSWTESFAIGDAQQLSLIKQEFRNVQKQIRTLKQKELRKQLEEKAQVLSKKIEEMDNGMRVSKVEPEEQESLVQILRSIEKKIDQALKNKENNINKEIKETTKEAKKLQKTGEVEELLKSIIKRLNSIEKCLEKEKVMPKEHAEELKKKVSEVRKTIEEKKIKPSGLNILVEEMHLPTTVVHEDVSKLKKELEKAKEKKPEHAGKIEKAIKKAEKVEEKIKENEAKAIITKAKIEESSKIDEKKMVTDYINGFPIGTELTTEEIAEQLNIPEKEVKKAVKVLAKEKKVKLKNFGYLAKATRKKPSIIRTK